MGTQSSQRKTFLTISAHLTGYDELDLLGTGMTDRYFETIMDTGNVPDGTSFLTTSAQIIDDAKGDSKKLNDDILTKLIPDKLFGGLAKKVITMWYMGTWNNSIINTQSYIQGLIWKAAEAHPPGAKQPGFASWQIAPLKVK